MVKKVLTDLVQEGSIRRGFLGVELASSKDGSGAVIEKIVPGSAADLAGFIPKDKIIRVGDRKVDSINQSRLVISQTAPGTKLPIDVIRSGKKITLFVTLDLMGSKNRLSIPGIVMEPLSLENRLEFQIPTTTKGVVVTNSTGDAETFKKGVVIVEVNGYQVNSVQDVEEQIKTGINRLYVWYRNKYRFLAYRVP
jgi:serine protease Do